MKRRLPGWMLLLIAAIIFVGIMIWTRVAPEKQDDSLSVGARYLSDRLGLEMATTPSGASGLVVNRVRPGGLGEWAGFHQGDRIVAVGDRSIWHVYGLANVVSERFSMGIPAVFLVARGSEYLQIMVGPGAQPGARPQRAPSP
jgi:S1-C subfamily serine protease